MAGALTAQDAAVLLVGGAACVTDFRSRRIPNVLTFGSSAAAVVFWGVSNGWPGVGWSVAGWAVGCLLFLPWFLLGGMGAGDVKLLAALGAWAGPELAVWIALYAGVAGGVFAVIVSLSQGYLREMLSNLWALLAFWRVMGVQAHPEMTLRTGRGPRLPYAFPITAGAVAVLWLR
jgi:prepilin peptidase CpaA